MRKKNKEIVGVIGQYGSGCLLAAGLVVEIILLAHIGFVLITAGGLVWGAATKLRGK